MYRRVTRLHGIRNGGPRRILGEEALEELAVLRPVDGLEVCARRVGADDFARVQPAQFLLGNAEGLSGRLLGIDAGPPQLAEKADVDVAIQGVEDEVGIAGG